MTDTETKQEKEALITIAGGVDMEVTHLDGRKETVKVRQIPATKLERFMTRLADESTSVAIYCDKESSNGWVDSLSHESINAVCEKGLEINEPFLAAWCRRRAKWTEMMNVGVIADLQKKLETLNTVLASVSSAQASLTTTNSPQEK
jgi:hypothetical protein